MNDAGELIKLVPFGFLVHIVNLQIHPFYTYFDYGNFRSQSSFEFQRSLGW